MRAAALGLAVALAACGGDERGVPVTAADDPARPARIPSIPAAPLDTVYADSGLFVDPALRVDSLRADSLRADSLRRDSLARRPDFRAFFPGWRARTAASDTLRLAGAPVDAAFREGLLALTARDFARDGDARTADVVVGYDADGRVVPQDEAVREGRLRVRFEVAEGAYRLASAERVR